MKYTLASIIKTITAVGVIVTPTYFGTRWIVRAEVSAEKTPKIEQSISDLTATVNKGFKSIDSTLSVQNKQIKAAEIKQEITISTVEKQLKKSPDKQDLIDFIELLRNSSSLTERVNETICSIEPMPAKVTPNKILKEWNISAKKL
jgi:hypothetical protein